MNPDSFPPNPQVAILGSGSWGTALATVLAPTASSVLLIGRDPKVLDDINTNHHNERYLNGVDLPDNISASDDLSKVVGAELILFVVASAATRSVAEKLAALDPNPNAILLACSKGIERGTGKRMSEIISELLPKQRLAVLSGPNHAEEVCRGLATATVIGSTSEEVSAYLQGLFTAPTFRSYTSDDLAGIEWGGAIKNVFAIASGIAKGLGLGDNATAALVTRGLAEMIRLGTALGGRPDTFVGLSGVGDLIATCYSNHSRNYRAGISIGHGNTVQETLDAEGMVVEGIPNCQSIHEAAHRAGVRTPLIDALHAVLYEDKPAASALQELLTRTPRSEKD
ncbi:MAG: NAD(P)H-dependent glycerol-3-phosphate dehydrogenase [Roseibacillus sp.]